MANITERYIETTRNAKRTIRERANMPRSTEEQRVYAAFRRNARDAYSTLKSGN